MDLATNIAQQKQLMASYEKMQDLKIYIDSGLADELDVANYHLARYNFFISVKNLSIGPGRKDIAALAEEELKKARNYQQEYRRGNPLPSEEELMELVFERLGVCPIENV